MDIFVVIFSNLLFVDIVNLLNTNWRHMLRHNEDTVINLWPMKLSHMLLQRLISTQQNNECGVVCATENYLWLVL